MSIKLKELPKMLNCPSPIVAIGVAEVISEALGYQVDENMKARHMQSLENICIQIERNMVARWSSRTQSGEPTVESLSDFLDKYEEKPLKVGSYEVETRPNGVQIGCTLVTWETVRKVAALEPKREVVITTPLEEREYRLLDDDEVNTELNTHVYEIQLKTHEGSWDDNNYGNSPFEQKRGNYRTKLTRAELRAKRGLPPEAPVLPKHNPAGLTDAQVEVSEGWRLLDNNEVPGLFKMGTTQYWGSDRGWRGDNQINSAYNADSGTLRTKLSREELATQRL